MSNEKGSTMQVRASHEYPQGAGLTHRRRRNYLLVTATMVAGTTALLVPTVFVAANAATSEEFSADVLTGEQIYQCREENGTSKFVFLKPVAELARGIHHDQGPVWQASDGSAIRGSVTQSTPRDGTIPELTLSATSFGAQGLLSGITQIRRINTGGGVAPTRQCQPGETVGVPYTATYIFSGTQTQP